MNRNRFPNKNKYKIVTENLATVELWNGQISVARFSVLLLTNIIIKATTSNRIKYWNGSQNKII